MIGIVIVAHGGLAEEIVNTTAMIVGEKPPAIVGVAVTGLEKPEEIRQQIDAAIRSVDRGRGVVVFTDMFGGTPSNIALSFLKENHVEVISGVNLPMLVDMIYSRGDGTLDGLSRQLADVGRNSIRTASDYLRHE